MLVALRTRAVAYAAAGRHADAVRDLRELEKRGRALGRGRGRARRQPAARGPGEGGRARAREARSATNPTFAQPLLSLAAVQREGARLRGGERGLREGARARARQPGGAARAGGRGRCIEGDAAQAGSRYARIVELDPTDVARAHQARRRPGCARARLTRRSSCSGELSSWIRRAPRRCSTWRAPSPRRAARPRRCRSSSAALAVGPRTTMVLNGLGLARLQLGDRGGAATAFRESLRIDPRQPDIASTLRELGQP